MLPQELIQEIDSLVGPRGRSAFLVETARAELRRRRLLAFLRDDRPAWDAENHPELVPDAGGWVQRLRSEGESRIPANPKPRKRSK